MYEEIYVMCQNVEKVMEMFSKELIQLDRNTVQYMIDEMQDTVLVKLFCNTLFDKYLTVTSLHRC